MVLTAVDTCWPTTTRSPALRPVVLKVCPVCVVPLKVKVAVIEAGCRQRLFRVREPKFAAMALFDMVTGLTHWFSPKDEGDLDRVAGDYAGAAVAMLKGWDAD